MILFWNFFFCCCSYFSSYFPGLFSYFIRHYVFVLRSAKLGPISCMRLDCRKDIQSVKWAWLVLHSELKAHILPLIQGIIRNVICAHTETHTYLILCYFHFYLFVECFLKNFEFQDFKQFLMSSNCEKLHSPIPVKELTPK